MQKLKDFFLANSKVSSKEAYEYGKDYGMNGANQTNCHFSIFSSNENTAAWERGKREATTPPSAKES